MTLRHLALKSSKILAQVDANVGWITINNPERRNAISLEMWRGLGDVAALVDACFDSDDHKDGGRAFMDKRTPAFTST